MAPIKAPYGPHHHRGPVRWTPVWFLTFLKFFHLRSYRHPKGLPVVFVVGDPFRLRSFYFYPFLTSPISLCHLKAFFCKFFGVPRQGHDQAHATHQSYYRVPVYIWAPTRRKGRITNKRTSKPERCSTLSTIGTALDTQQRPEMWRRGEPAASPPLPQPTDGCHASSTCQYKIQSR